MKQRWTMLAVVVALIAFLVPAIAQLNVSGSGGAPTLSGTTGSIGGGALGAGACTSGTVAIAGATTGMPVAVAPAGGADPTNNSVLAASWEGRVSSAGVVTVSVCVAIIGTPAAANYNVRVIQ